MFPFRKLFLSLDQCTVSGERDYNLSEVAVNEYLVQTAHHSESDSLSLTRFSRRPKS
jgi:hypothetical protein